MSAHIVNVIEATALALGAGLILADALGHLFPHLPFGERRRFAWGALSAVALFVFALQVAR